jgi:U3 small nucleolar RNA-associated protein 23
LRRRRCSLSDLSAHIPKLLGGRTKLFTTKCVTAELRKLGPEFAQSAQVGMGLWGVSSDCVCVRAARGPLAGTGAGGMRGGLL